MFYLDGKGHGLVAAPSDQGRDIPWWKGNDISTGATATWIGSGKANTVAIVSKQGMGNYAASLCDNLVLGGFDDWFLPSRDELNLMYTNLKKTGRGGFASAWYWSSSENYYYSAWKQYFEDGRQYLDYLKNLENGVRAVRAF